jgi:hypothetical protein
MPNETPAENNRDAIDAQLEGAPIEDGPAPNENNAADVVIVTEPTPETPPGPTEQTPPCAETPATQKQKIVLAVLLVLFSVLVTWAWFCVLNRVENILHKEYTISWEAPANLQLRPGPAGLFYDREAKKMSHRGPIDSKLKTELAALPVVVENDAENATAIQSYNDAISNLAYKSGAELDNVLMLLLVFGGLSAVLGNQLRTDGNFVNVIVKANKLDVNLWWPWYAIPPFISFVLGVVIVLMIKAELIQLGDKVPTGSLWWAAIAFLAGFGASDFTDRLRLLTQTLFGKGSPT